MLPEIEIAFFGLSTAISSQRIAPSAVSVTIAAATGSGTPRTSAV
ncbi:hypothetical protein [Paracoccus cavernae]